MEWLKGNVNNPIFLLAVAVAVIALWFVYQRAKEGATN